MYPNQQPQLSPQPLPVDYLDQIAPTPKKPGMNNKLFFGIVGGGIALIFVVAGLLFAAGSGGPKVISVERLGLRLQALEKISSDAQKNIKDSELSAINSRLTTHLVNTNRDITAPLETANINLKRADKKLVAEEEKTMEKLSLALENDRLNGRFDQTYAREMAHQLDEVSILMESLFKSSKSKSLKDFLGSSFEKITALQKELENFGSTDG